MKNIFHNKVWGEDTNPVHVEPPSIPLVKSTSTSKSDGNHVKLNLRRDTTSSTSDLYEFRMSLFDHGEPYEFLFFVRYFKMTLAAIIMLETGAKVQYLCPLVHEEALPQFELLSSNMRNT